jgi:hypothetical protein
MIADKKHSETHRDPMIFGTISWIASEIIGIRTLEQRLCKKLESRTPTDNRFLLDEIRDLNSRVQVLDRALDNYGSGSRWT